MRERGFAALLQRGRLPQFSPDRVKQQQRRYKKNLMPIKGLRHKNPKLAQNKAVF